MEKWRIHYHDQNQNRELPIDDLICHACKEPFSFHEIITMINDQPYCSDDCFLSIQKREEWQTVDEPDPKDLASDFFQTCTKKEKEAILQFISYYHLDFQE